MGTIVLQGIDKEFATYPPLHVLIDCSADIAAGELVSIVGPSGSGKSSLLNIIGLLDVPSSGRYLLKGEDVTQMDDRQRTHLRATAIGFVFQSFYLIPHYSALENVALGRLYGRSEARRHRLQAAEKALSKVDMSHRLHAFPGTMSGGENQRVAIARALVNEPSVILCDEPTGNLDSVATRSILALLSSLAAAGICILIVTHDEGVAAASQRRLTILDGVLSEAAL